MKTAMQELIDYMKTYFHLTDESLEMFDKSLEKEKEQMVNFAKKYANYVLDDKPFISVKDFFYQTYNQNK